MARAFLLAAAVLGFCAVVVLGADIEDCTENSELGEYVEATISDCSVDDVKCPLHRGHNVSLTLKFKAKKEIPAVTHVVHGILPAVPVPVPFPLDNPNACQNAGLQCPLTEGEHTYQYGLFIKTSYPKLSVKVKWELFAEKKQIVCVMIPAVLK